MMKIQFVFCKINQIKKIKEKLDNFRKLNIPPKLNLNLVMGLCFLIINKVNKLFKLLKINQDLLYKILRN